MERWGKINSLNSVCDNWTGIGVKTAFFASAGMMAWPYLKISGIVAQIIYLQILQCIRTIEKLATS
jgi:hypothetical protein